MKRPDDMACVQVRDLLPLAAGQDLADAPARAVWGHLSGCMACRREYSTYLERRSALAELDPGRLGKRSGQEEFFAELQEDVLAQVGRGSSTGSRRTLPRLRLAAAAAVLLLAGALVIPDEDAGGLLQRDPIPGQPTLRNSVYVPLYYPQGLAAQQEVELVFGTDMVPTWPARLEGWVADRPVVFREDDR